MKQLFDGIVSTTSHVSTADRPKTSCDMPSHCASGGFAFALPFR